MGSKYKPGGRFHKTSFIRENEGNRHMVSGTVGCDEVSRDEREQETRSGSGNECEWEKSKGQTLLYKISSAHVPSPQIP